MLEACWSSPCWAGGGDCYGSSPICGKMYFVFGPFYLVKFYYILLVCSKSFWAYFWWLS